MARACISILTLSIVDQNELVFRELHGLFKIERVSA